MKRLFMKIIATAISIILIAAVISGCTGSSKDKSTPQTGTQDTQKKTEQTPSVTEKPKEKIKVTWMKWGSPAGVESRRDLLFKQFPELGDQYILEPVIAGKQPVDVAQKMRLSMAANAEISDVVNITYPMLMEFVLSGAIEDLSDVYAPYKDKLIPAALDCVTVNGKQYAFINQIKPKSWFYRKDMFDAAGIDPAKIKTTDDFIAAGKKLQSKYPKSYIWNIGPNIAHYNLGMVLSGNNGKFINEKNEYIVSKDPGVRAAFEDFKKIVKSGVVAPINDFTPDWEKGFADSTIASSLISVWFRDVAYLPKWAPDQAGKWAVAQWPEIGGAVGGSNEGAGILVIPKKAKNKEAAKKIMELLTLSKDGNIAHYMAVSTTHPIHKEAMSDPRVKKADPYFGDSLNPAIEEALKSFKLMPSTPASDREFQIMNSALVKYLTTNISLDDVLKEAESELKSQIGNPFELYNKK